MGLSMKLKKIREIPMLVIEGRLINVDSEKFLKRLDQLCKKNFRRVIIDISNVEFIDSFGLGALVQQHTRFQKENRQFIIVNANNTNNTYVNRLFEITGLNNIFTIVESVDFITP